VNQVAATTYAKLVMQILDSAVVKGYQKQKQKQNEKMLVRIEPQKDCTARLNLRAGQLFCGV
jgi:hypothetical protein